MKGPARLQTVVKVWSDSSCRYFREEQIEMREVDWESDEDLVRTTIKNLEDALEAHWTLEAGWILKKWVIYTCSWRHQERILEIWSWGKNSTGQK